MGRRQSGPYDRKWLRNLRERKGLSQNALGDLAGVSKGMVSRYEQGYGKPSIPIAQDIARVLEFDPQMWVDERELS